MPDLFDPPPDETPSLPGTPPRDAPLADRMRPARLADVVGQDHLLGPGGALRQMLDGTLSSLIFWGPPGVGKTTLARLLATETDLSFVQISAILSGVADLKKLFEAARLRRTQGRGTLLFVDEIHRFNRAQQDSFLPVVEDGTVVLVGATTENPSFELNGALLSRCQVLVLERLTETQLETLASRAEGVMDRPLPLSPPARRLILEMADGDGRALLNLLEQAFTWDGKVTPEQLAKRLNKRAPAYDKSRDEHYNLISALHKSVRASDPDAALYWLARMLTGGEDPRYIARRVTRMAVEDIGLADPQANALCLAAWQTYERLGSPEGEIALAEAVLYLALAPKSNAAYVAYKRAMETARKTGSLPPPKNILNAPTGLMKDLGYGEGYVYEHDAPEGVSNQPLWPIETLQEEFYTPKEIGFERDLLKRKNFYSHRKLSQLKD